MRLGTIEKHKEIKDVMEELMKGLTELFMAHVHFKLHCAQPPA
jgi:hypothetical protein